MAYKKILKYILKYGNNLKVSFKRQKNISMENSCYVITFAGDTCLGDNDLRQLGDKRLLIRLKWRPLSFYRDVYHIVKDSDYFIVNLETVLEDRPFVEPFEGKKYIKWDNPNRTIKTLKKIGVTAVTMANNHIMDYGSELMLKTIEHIRKSGIKYLGAGKNIKEASAPIKIKIRGKRKNLKIFILNAMRASKRYKVRYGYFASKESSGVNPIGSKLRKRIAKLREDNPEALIIVCPHWQGLDYKWPNDKVKAASKKIIGSGADYIIGHGPHIMQQIEKYGSGYTAYSIGNFIFNTEGRHREMNAPPFSSILRLEFLENNKKWKVKSKFYLIVTDNLLQDYSPRPVTDAEAREAYRSLSSKANNLKEFQLNFMLNCDEKGWHLLNIGD